MFLVELLIKGSDEIITLLEHFSMFCIVTETINDTLNYVIQQVKQIRSLMTRLRLRTRMKMKLKMKQIMISLTMHLKISTTMPRMTTCKI